MMNNAKETLSSVKNVIPDFGGSFQLDPAVIESRKCHPYTPTSETKLCQNSQQVLKFCKQAVMEPRFGHELLEWKLY